MKLYDLGFVLLGIGTFVYLAFFVPDRALNEDNVLTGEAYVEVLKEDAETVKEKSKEAFEYYTTQGETANHDRYNK